MFLKSANITSISGLIVKSSHSLNDYYIKIHLLGKLIFMSSASFRLSRLHTTHVGFSRPRWLYCQPRGFLVVATCKQIVNSKQDSMPAHYLVNEKTEYSQCRVINMPS